MAQRDDTKEIWWAAAVNYHYAVRDFYISHLGCTQKQCADALGIDRKTVYRHLRAIRQEWESKERENR